jgi:rhodanese-related sulfurtransferase
MQKNIAQPTSQSNTKEKSPMYSTLSIAAVIIGALILFRALQSRGVSSIDAAAARSLAQSNDVTVLDVRSKQEYAGGHLKKARLIPVNELAGRLGELDPVKNKQILVYCHAGNRSLAAVNILRKNGFVKTLNLTGGITAWTGSGGEVVRGE